MKEIIGGLFAIACFVSAVWCWITGMIALHRAATARKPGVPYYMAFSSASALFRDSLYTDEGLALATRHLNLMAGFVAFVVLALVSRWLTR